MTERRFKWLVHVRMRPLEHVCGQILDMKQLETEEDRRQGWMDAAKGDIKIIGMERWRMMMAKTIDDHCGDPR